MLPQKDIETTAAARTVALQIAAAACGGVSSDRVEDSGIQDESWRANHLAQSHVSSAMSGDDCSAWEWD